MPSQTQSDIIATLSSCALSDIDAVLTPGECNVMLAFVDDAARNLSDLEALRAELAELRARVKEVPRTTEWHIAMREANQIHDADAYFAARSEMLDSGHNRHLFEAGYQRGFDAGEKVYAGTAAAAVPEDVAKDAERYRACRYAALAADNDPLIEQMLDWPNVSTADEFDIQTDQIAAILAAKEKGQ